MVRFDGGKSEVTETGGEGVLEGRRVVSTPIPSPILSIPRIPLPCSFPRQFGRTVVPKTEVEGVDGGCGGVFFGCEEAGGGSVAAQEILVELVDATVIDP